MTINGASALLTAHPDASAATAIDESPESSPTAPGLPVAADAAGLSVLLVAEGTYPYHFGGVSTWCHGLMSCLSDVPFHLVTISDNPSPVRTFPALPNALTLDNRVVWGGRFAGDGRSTARTGLRMDTEARRAVEQTFLPAYSEFLSQMFGSAFDPARCADAVLAMHRHFVAHGFDGTMRSEQVWELSQQRLSALLEGLAGEFGVGSITPTMTELTQLTAWLRHWLLVLAGPLPATAIVHTAMAGLCTLIAVAAKHEHGARFVLTEHGVYLREVYLAESHVQTDLLKLVRIRWARRLTELSYDQADQISPCCDFNQRWELHNGAAASKLRTIYYGMDPAIYTPRERTGTDGASVAWVGRINPLKDVETLLRAAALVCDERSDVTFNLYGSATEEDREYEQACRSLWSDLHLQGRVEFKGFTSRPQDAFNDADLVILPSISEGFPNSTLEAMLCGRTVVVTSVGGLPEQVAGAGIAVEPRNPRQLADAVSALLDDDVIRRQLGRAARHRASTRFTVERLRAEHLSSYQRLVKGLGAEPGLGRSGDEPTVRLVKRDDRSSEDGPERTIVIDDGGSGPQEEVIDLSQPTDRVALGALTTELAQHQPEPADPLEATALLESLGINDARARHVYSAPDVFVLGERVFAELGRRNHGREWWTHRAAEQRTLQRNADRVQARPTLRAVPLPKPANELVGAPTGRWRGLTALAASLGVLVLIQLARATGGWTPGQSIAVHIAVAFGMSTANGLALASSRSLSFYLAARNTKLVIESLRRVARWSIGTTIVGVVVLVAVHSFFDSDVTTAWLMVAGFTLTCVVWTVLAVASIMGRGNLALRITCVGLGFTIAGDRVLVRFTPAHLAMATVLGGVVMSVVAVVTIRRMGPAWTAGVVASRGPRVTALGPTIGDALPYFVCGLLGSLTLLAPHVLAWSNAGRSADWSALRSEMELGLTLGLLPFVISIGTSGNALESFWRSLPTILDGTPAQQGPDMGLRLIVLVRGLRTRYTEVLALRSAVTMALGCALMLTGVVAPLAEGTGVWWELGSLAIGLTAGLLFGVATFASMYSLSLGRPQPVAVALLASLLSVAVIGWPLAAVWSWRATLPSVLLSAGVYAVLAERACRNTLRRTAQLTTTIS